MYSALKQFLQPGMGVGAQNLLVNQQDLADFTL